MATNTSIGLPQHLRTKPTDAAAPTQDTPTQANPKKEKEKSPTHLPVALTKFREFLEFLDDTLQSFTFNFGINFVKTFAAWFYRNKKC